MVEQGRNLTTTYGSSPRPGMGNLRAEEQRQVLAAQAARYQAMANANMPQATWTTQGYGAVFPGSAQLAQSSMGNLQRLNYAQAMAANAARYTGMAQQYQQGNVQRQLFTTPAQRVWGQRYQAMADAYRNQYLPGSLGTLLPDTWLGQLNRRLEQEYGTAETYTPPPQPWPDYYGGSGYGYGGGGDYTPRMPGYGNYSSSPRQNSASVGDWYGQMIAWNINNK
jgi:hypothetical protein